MRDLLNLIDNIVTESVGLANRRPGTVFANPQGNQLVFQGVSFYPPGGGEYETPEQWQQALAEVCKQSKIDPALIQWTDSNGNPVPAPKNQKGGFGIAHFVGDKGKQHFLARYLKKVSPILTQNEFSNKLPGGYRLQTAVAQKEAVGYKPTDVLGSNLDNLSPADIIGGIQAKFGVNSNEANATEIFMSSKSYPIRIPLGNMNFTAFTNYFCEMLQPMALVLGHKTTGQGKKAEQDWLNQGGYASCRITFGGSKIGGLTDSTLINPAGQTMGLSSKAEGGAKASAKNLLDKINEMRQDPDGVKLLEKYKKEVSLLGVVTAGSTPGALNTAVLAKIITPEERDQIMGLQNLPAGTPVVGQQLLSPALEKRYQERKAQDPSKIIPFYHIRAAIAIEVADWVNTTTNFGKAAAEILNWGSFIQVETHASLQGNEIVMQPFFVKYPTQATTDVLLSAGKTFYSTGSKGNFTFKILMNGASDVDDVAEDQDTEIAAPTIPAEKYGTKATLGRDRQRT